MSNDEYQQQQFWNNSDKEIKKSLEIMAEAVVSIFKPRKFPLSFLTKSNKSDNNKLYTWKIKDKKQ